MKETLTRRSFVKAAASATVLATGCGAPTWGQVVNARPVALFDARLPATLAATMHAGGIPIRNLVQQWHNGLREQVTECGATALVRWDLALMLRQLGRETQLSAHVASRADGAFDVELSVRRAMRS